MADTRTYECEACGRVDELTEEAAFEAGWDYPPFIGQWGTVSPRTCGDCGVDRTAWWALVTGKHLTDHQLRTVERITQEVPHG